MVRIKRVADLATDSPRRKVAGSRTEAANHRFHGLFRVRCRGSTTKSSWRGTIRRAIGRRFNACHGPSAARPRERRGRVRRTRRWDVRKQTSTMCAEQLGAPLSLGSDRAARDWGAAGDRV